MYSTELHIALRHEYYLSGNYPVSLSPTAETARFLARYDMLFRKQNANNWLLVSQNDLASIAVVETRRATSLRYLRFALHATDHTLYYVTRAWKPNPAFTVESAMGHGAWQTLSIDVQYLVKNKQKEIIVEAETEEKYLEFLCIPKFNGADIPLRMTEEKQRIQVKEDTERATLPDSTVARRFVTTEKIKLRQDNGIKMQLWEAREMGERLISTTIPCPQPLQPSLFSPKDMLTHIHYY
jgi:hypothetical protein